MVDVSLNCQWYIAICEKKIRQTLVHDIQKQWTAVSTLLDLIKCVYRDLQHWRSNQQPQIAEQKLYNWATCPYRTQVTPNQLVMLLNKRKKQASYMFPHSTWNNLFRQVYNRGLRLEVVLFTQFLVTEKNLKSNFIFC